MLVPFAPARTVVDRFRASAEQILTAHGLSRAFVEAEIAEMAEHRLATTKNRSVVGVMNEFVRLAEVPSQGGRPRSRSSVDVALPDPVRTALQQARQP